MGRVILIAALVAMAFAIGPATGGSSSVTMRFAPVADSYVKSKPGNQNYGGEKHLNVDAGSIVQRSYLRFSIQGLSGSVLHAWLVVRSEHASDDGFDVRRVGSNWTESGITWQNAPAPGALVASSGKFKKDASVRVDVSSLVTGNGNVDLAVTATPGPASKNGRDDNDPAIVLASRENTDNPPHLELEVSGNSPPLAIDDSASTNEDTPLVLPDSVVLANDTDPDGNILTVTGVASTANTHGSVSHAGGQITYTPSPDYNGAADFRYSISDGAGGTASALVHVTVVPVNDAPVALDGSATANEGSAKTITLNAHDVDSPALTFSIVSAPNHGSLGPISGNSVDYTPNPGYSGPDSFTFKANDGSLDSNVATISLTDVNLPPVATDGTANATEGSSTTITMAAGDPGGESLTYSIVTPPSHGSLGAISGNHVGYTPNPGYSGPDSFTFKASDGSLDSNVATISLSDTNLPPVASDVSASTPGGTPTTVTLSASDPGGEPLTFSIVGGPAHGSLGAISGDSVDYTPDSGFVGTDTFTYSASDGSLASNVATVTVDVLNRPPTANDDSVSADSNSPLKIASGTLTANDTDPDGDPLSVTDVAGGTDTHGSVSLAGGVVTYTAAAGFSGSASFQYTIGDGRGGTASATVHVTVDYQPSAPIRAAFYYPWFPESWNQQGLNPFTQYTPSLLYYSSTAVTPQHIHAMQYGHIQVGIASWWGVGSNTDVRFPGLLAAAAGSDFRWAIYYEPEGQGNPTVGQIESDLAYIRANYGSSPSYERLDGRFVVFVYADPADDCSMADRWKQANDDLGDPAYVVLKDFAGFRTCASQPDGWHQYAPDQPENSVLPWSFAVSPGFYKANESSPRLYRDTNRFRQNIRDMVASGATFDLVETFNEWGEGTAVEDALQWQSNSGYGEYLDALHDDGAAVTSDPVVVTAGDIASSRPDDEKTADLLQLYPAATVFTLGDNAYEQGLLSEFNAYYTPSWGRPDIMARTHPSVGNHEYSALADAADYFTYFGAAAGLRGQGWYSFDLGTWHVVVLNSNCSHIGGCGLNSPEDLWLKADLAAHPNLCTLAYWHHPRFSSGVTHGSNTAMGQFWTDLYNAGADLVLNGHEHNYERFAPQTPGAVADPVRGIREIVAGTGGKDGDTYTLGPRIANSEVGNDTSLGVLKLILHPGSYEWRFLPEGGDTFTDSGSTACHA
jgi:Big-like domain-containing protein/calcineurin-like phosphoesterase family protein